MALIDRSSYRQYDVSPHDAWFAGMDIGQANDSSAFAVVQHRIIPGGEWEHDDTQKTSRQSKTERFDLRYLERLPLKMSYVQQCEHVAALLARPPLDSATFGLDFVSVGRPVAEIFTRMLRGRTVYRVLTTAGNEVTKHGGNEWHVPKQILVSQLEARLHSGEFRIAAELSEAETLKDELKDFGRTVSESGRVTFNARGSAHDDCVFAVCAALFLATGGRHSFSSEALQI